MGSPSLQPDMKDESVDLQLEDGLLRQLKDKFCCRVKVRSSEDAGDMRQFCTDTPSFIRSPVAKRPRAPEITECL